MAVRANKPAFNIREKLKELTSKFGLKGTELARAETVQDARNAISAGRKNKIINGDLRIWQRSTSATINNAVSQSVLTADRWNNYHNTDGVVTESRSTDVPTGSGFYYSLKHEVATADTSIGTAQYHSHKYDIEGYDVAHLMWGTSLAKPITVSFWAKSSVTGDYGFSIRPGANNNRFYVDTITISQSNTWKKYSFTVPGCPDGTWEKANSAGLQVQISHVMGTTYQTSSLRQWISSVVVSPPSQVNWMATVGNTWYITGLQVEVGKNATEFEHRPYGEELALCERYYYQIGSSVGASGGSRVLGPAYTPSTNEIAMAVFHPTTMRVKPACTIVNTNANNNLSALRFRYTGNNNFALSSSGTINNTYMTTQGGSVWFQGLSHGVTSSGEIRTNESNGAGEFTFLRFNAEL